jgi:hypothetical protein
MENKTSEEFEQVVKSCKEIFEKKLRDYGPAWRILRLESITDQIFIKANRIRSFEVKQVQKIDEDARSEYIGIINYCVIALIQLELGYSDIIDMTPEKAFELYDTYIGQAKQLMENKNHDYDEAWRKMRVSSYTDLILMKLFRIKQIEDNKGKTLISEGVEANYFDIINYAVFALIKTGNTNS